MRNKILAIIVTLVVLLGLGLLIYSSIYPKIHPSLERDEKEYIVYFYQTDCGYCQAIESDVANFIENGNIKLYKINMQSEKHQGKWDDYGVSGTPTMFYVRDGRVQKKVVGSDKSVELMNKYLD